jgi:hypothetical protein
MPDLKKYLRSPEIQIAMAVGVSMLAFAASSAWVPMNFLDPLLLTIPPLIEVVHWAFSREYKDAWFMKTWYWVCAILASTALLILLRALR